MINDKAKKILVIVFFAVIGVLADQVKVTALVGAKGQAFTLLQLFAPAVGAFLGSITGVVTVLLTEVASFIIQGKEPTVMNLVRLLPMLFATIYFASIMKPRGSLNLVPEPVEGHRFWLSKVFLRLRSGNNYFIEIGVPALAMLTFWAHPEGRQAWYYALYWTIPMIVSMSPLRKTVVARSLGSTFTAHAVGGAYWIWTTNMAAPLWIALIPIVALERAVFGLGIAITFLVVNYLLSLSPVLRSLPIQISGRHLFGTVK